jgi:pyruvate/2-oxoglutarate dehydrogenase complex dihydrolipoamide acyltransferase (E2) component
MNSQENGVSGRKGGFGQMAQQVVVEMVDDLDGSVGQDVATVSFALDGRSYEIDLSEGNADKLRGLLADFVAAARRHRGGRAGRRARSAPSASADQNARQRAQAIREWAQEAGHQLSERGRIPANVVEAYEEAQRSGSPTKDAKAEAPANAEAPAKAEKDSGGEKETKSSRKKKTGLPSFSG